MTLAERWAAFSRRERILIIAAVVTAIGVVVRYAPIGSLGELSMGGGGDERWIQARKIESYQKILSRAEAVQAQRVALDGRYAAAQARLIPGSTPTQVGAELQGRLSVMASDAGLNVLSSQILKEEEAEDFRRVGVRLTLSGELKGVASLLAAIESGGSDIAVTTIEINRKLGAARRPPPSRTRTTADTAALAPLTATLEVRTFMQRSAS